jgi:hypothetical protein
LPATSAPVPEQPTAQPEAPLDPQAQAALIEETLASAGGQSRTA